MNFSSTLVPFGWPNGASSELGQLLLDDLEQPLDPVIARDRPAWPRSPHLPGPAVLDEAPDRLDLPAADEDAIVAVAGAGAGPFEVVIADAGLVPGLPRPGERLDRHELAPSAPGEGDNSDAIGRNGRRVKHGVADLVTRWRNIPLSFLARPGSRGGRGIYERSGDGGLTRSAEKLGTFPSLFRSPPPGEPRSPPIAATP